VWTGSAVLVWGGTERSNPYQCGNYDTCTPVAGGALFDPVANAWTTLPEKDAPRGEGTLVSSPRAVLVGGEGAALFDLASCAWNPIAGAPQPLVDPYARAYSDGSTFVVLGRGGAALSRGAAWTVVPQPRNDSNTIWPTITNAPPGMNVAVLDFGPGGAPPRQNGGRIGTALRFDAGATRWERAPLPPTGGPASLIGPIVWTGDRLVFWGGFTREIDPGGGNGCGGAVRPCDPVVATRDVMQREGAMIAPVFAPY
jgi:hypothetical protein